VAFSSDVCDWNTMLEICRQLKVGIPLPRKTYAWIEGMVGCPDFEPYKLLKGTIAELLCSIASRQENILNDTDQKLGGNQLTKLLRCIDLLLPEVKDTDSAKQEQQKLRCCGAAADMTRGQAHNRILRDNCANLPRIKDLYQLLKKAKIRVETLLEINGSHAIEDPGDQLEDSQTFGRRACTHKSCDISGYNDRWWPRTPDEMKAFTVANPEAEELTESCPDIRADELNDGNDLLEQLKKVNGGMVSINEVEHSALWKALCEWMNDERTLQMVGSSQRDVSSGLASFQLLRMENGIPRAISGKSTLEDFLRRRSWSYAVAAVGLPAWQSDHESDSVNKLWKAMMEVLEGLGMDTSPTEDVLALAGVQLCGVGVRRPEVYIKRGKGQNEPFITLRHAEWGHSSAFNMVLNAWRGDKPLLANIANEIPNSTKID